MKRHPETPIRRQFVACKLRAMPVYPAQRLIGMRENRDAVSISPTAAHNRARDPETQQIKDRQQERQAPHSSLAAFFTAIHTPNARPNDKGCKRRSEGDEHDIHC